MEKRLFFISSLFLTSSYGSQMSDLTPPCTSESQESALTQRTFSGFSSEQLDSDSGLPPKPALPHLYPSTKEGKVINVPPFGLSATTVPKIKEKEVCCANEDSPLFLTR